MLSIDATRQHHAFSCAKRAGRHAAAHAHAVHGLRQQQGATGVTAARAGASGAQPSQVQQQRRLRTARLQHRRAKHELQQHDVIDPADVIDPDAVAGEASEASEAEQEESSELLYLQDGLASELGENAVEQSDDEEEGGGAFGEEAPEELSTARHVILEPDFLPAAEQLRAVFDERFQDPRRTHRQRFLWDYWHVERQYTLVRTQAQAYFPAPLYKQLEDALLAYGEQRLGCRAISPIWLSFYIDGCCQELHCDSFHGPFAFVLSLTHWEGRQFSGGETAILRPQVLDFWGSAFQPGVGLELGDLLQLVEPHFNQLTVFDPRLPHGVRPVRGTMDPQKARLVLHGWFTEPEPFVDGPLDDVAEPLNDALQPLFDDLALLPPALGTITTRLTVDGGDGTVTNLEWLVDTLVVPPAAAAGEEGGAAAVRARVQAAVDHHLRAARFPAPEASGDTLITLPLVFE